MKHSPIWFLPLITANVVDVVVAHKPISVLWLNVGVLLLILFLNYPMHLLYVRCLSGSVRRMTRRYVRRIWKRTLVRPPSRGRIVEVGRHDDLLRRGGAYANLHLLHSAVLRGRAG